MYIGVDIVILALLGCVLVVASGVTTALAQMSEEVRNSAVISTAITAAVMVLGYSVMAEVLDAMLGAFGW